MKNKGFTKRGFTIIELIVVIAIIAVLSSIVMVNVTQYTKKAKDAAFLATLNSFPTNASIYFESHGNYGAFCNDTKTEQALDQLAKMVNKVRDCVTSDPADWNICCHHNSDNWAVCVKSYVDNSKALCVDYMGTKKVIDNSNCKANITTCN